MFFSFIFFPAWLCFFQELANTLLDFQFPAPSPSPHCWCALLRRRCWAIAGGKENDGKQDAMGFIFSSFIFFSQLGCASPSRSTTSRISIPARSILCWGHCPAPCRGLITLAGRIKSQARVLRYIPGAAEAAWRPPSQAAAGPSTRDSVGVYASACSGGRRLPARFIFQRLGWRAGRPCRRFCAGGHTIIYTTVATSRSTRYSFLSHFEGFPE
jgi:hypothetical protein